MERSELLPDFCSPTFANACALFLLNLYRTTFVQLQNEERNKKRIIPYEKTDKMSIVAAYCWHWLALCRQYFVGMMMLCFSGHIRSHFGFYLQNVLNVKASQATEHIATQPTQTFFNMRIHCERSRLSNAFRRFVIKNFIQNDMRSFA